jgi:hypothetical protein
VLHLTRRASRMSRTDRTRRAGYKTARRIEKPMRGFPLSPLMLRACTARHGGFFHALIGAVMSANWIKWNKGLASRREVAVLASRLNRDRHEIAGRLMVLWEWCDDNVSEADIDILSLDVSLNLGDKPFEFLDQITGLTGLAESLACPSVGWIAIGTDGRVVFCNLARNNGSTAKTRATATEKKQRQRKASAVSPEKRDNCPEKTGTKMGTKPGPDKRREEKNREENNPPPSGGGDLRAQDFANIDSLSPGDGPTGRRFAGVETEFVATWNSLPTGNRGVVRVSGVVLPPTVKPLLRAAWDDEARWQALQQALGMIRDGTAYGFDMPALTVTKLLAGDEVDQIVSGSRSEKRAAFGRAGSDSPARVRDGDTDWEAERKKYARTPT